MFWMAKRKGDSRPFMILESGGHFNVEKDSSNQPSPGVPERSTSLTSSDADGWNPSARPVHYASTRRRSLSNYTTTDGSTYDMDRGSRVPAVRTVIRHYDGGRARAGMQQPGGVVELPPEYRNPSMYSDSVSETAVGRPTNKRRLTHTF